MHVNHGATIANHMYMYCTWSASAAGENSDSEKSQTLLNVREPRGGCSARYSLRYRRVFCNVFH